MQVLLGVLERVSSAFLLLFQLLYLRNNRVVGQFNQEHLLLLLDELSDALWSLLPVELDAGLGYLASGADVGSLVHIEVVNGFIGLSWQNIAIFDAFQRHAGRGSLLVPDLELLGCFLRLSFLLFLGLSLNEHLLFVWWPEGRLLVSCLG